MVLETALHPPVHGAALYLGDLHLERPLEAPGGDEGEAGGRVAGPRVNVEVVPGVAAADDRNGGAARHHKPGREYKLSWLRHIVGSQGMLSYLLS